MNPNSKTVEDIREEIENLGNNGILEESLTENLNDIANVEDENERIELYSSTIDKIKKIIVNGVYENADQLNEDIEKYRNIFTNANLEQILLEKEFTYDSVIKERNEKGIDFSEKEEKKEIEIIYERIDELEEKFLNLARYNVLKAGLNSILKDLNNQKENAPEEELDNLKIQIENLEKDLDTLEKSNKSKEEIEEVTNKYGIDVEKIEEEIKKDELYSLEEIEEELADLNNEFVSLQSELDSVEKEIERLDVVLKSNEDDGLTEEEKQEVQAIKAELSKRENKYSNMTVEELQKEAKRLQEIINLKKVMVGEEQRELSKIEEELAKRQKTNGISLEDLRKKYNEMSLDELRAEEKRLKNIINLKKVMVGEEQKQLKELQDILSKRENKYNNMTVEELQKEAKRLQEIINLKKVMVGEEKRELSKIEEELAKRQKTNGISLEDLRKKYNEMPLDELRAEEKRLKNIINLKKVMVGEEQKQLKELQDILSKRENKYSNMTVEELQKEAKRLQEIINLKKVMVGEEQRELSKIEEELAKRSKIDLSNISTQDLQKRLEELEKKNQENSPKNKEEIQNQLEEKIKQRASINNKIIAITDKLNKKSAEKLEAQDLKKHKEYREAYNSILEAGASKFGEGNEDPDLLNNIEEFVKSHPQSEVFNNYERKDKLIKELIEDIHNMVKKKTVTDPKKNPKLWAQALAGAAGFVAGLGASCVPGVGTIRMGLFGLHLLHESAEIVASAFPESKITKLYDAAKERYQNSVVAKAYKRLRSKPLVRIALGGFTVGYIAGNVYELIKGETILETLKGDTPDIDPNDVVIDSEPTPPDPEIEDITPEDPSIEEIIPEDITIDTPKPGDVHDLSEIDFGYKSSDAEEAVHLMQNIGNKFEFEKIEKLANGKERWHYKQLNGQGYSWFDKETVVEVLKKQAKEAMKTSGGRTI